MSDWRCAKCGHANPPGATFCGECGAPVPAAPPGVRCRRCGFDKNPSMATYCVKCGKALRHKSRAGWFVAGGLLAVLLALGAAGVFLWRAGWIQDQLPNLPLIVQELVVQVGLVSPTPRRPAQPDPTTEPSPTLTPIPAVLPSPTPAPVVAPTATGVPSLTPSPPPTAPPTATPTDTSTPSPTPSPTLTPTPFWAPSANFDLLVLGTQARSPAGVQVQAGDRVRIEYLSGQWRPGPPPTWNLVGPEGDPRVGSKDTFPVRQAPLMSLIAGVGDAPPVPVGPGTEFEASAGGILWLGANDDRFDDNGGNLLVRVQIISAWATPPPPLPPGQIVFTCFIGEFDEICRMDTDGSNEARLTNDPATDWYASWSPDGRQIVFSSRRDGDFEVYAMNPDGSDQRRLTEGIGSLYAPAVSPDGQRILFSAYRGGSQNLWLMDRDGRNPFQLTDSASLNEDPVWSPDGRQIAFASDRDGEFAHYVVNADGSGTRLIPAAVAEIGGRSDWSPDGRWLAFYAGPDNDRDIYVAAIDGSELRRLTYGGANVAPSFSPDGQWITFMSRRDGDAEIFVMRIDGTGVTQVTFNNRPDWQPRWGGAR